MEMNIRVFEFDGNLRAFIKRKGKIKEYSLKEEYDYGNRWRFDEIEGIERARGRKIVPMISKKRKPSRTYGFPRVRF